MKKKIIIAFVLLIILSTYSPYKNLNITSLFKINRIIVENNSLLEEAEVRNQLSFLYKSNIFFLDDLKTKNKIPKESFIESLEIKKIYPRTLRVKIFEKEPIAVIQNKKEKKFFTKKGYVAKYFESEKIQNLPIVFGDEKNFKIFYTNLKKTNFPIKIINSFYLFDSNRWDLIIKDNRTIKLPNKNYIERLKNFLDIKDYNNLEKYKIFDYRINNQLILK